MDSTSPVVVARFVLFLLLGAVGCSSGSKVATAIDSGVVASGGATIAGGGGGTPGSGGTISAGATGGATGATGGSSPSAGGNSGAAGAIGTGGTATGGSTIGGGNKGSGGSAGSGGTTASTGGVTGTGGSAASGGGGSGRDASAPADGARDAGDAPRDVAMDVAGIDVTDGGLGIQGPQTFHCVNWADPRDNFVDGLLALSGLSSSSDTYATVQTKAGDILSEFQSKLKANAIRIPINEPTVSSTWWSAYQAVIDTAVGKGMKVIVAYWAYQNGKPDDAAAFKAMWQVVVAAYQSNDLVYFDIHNEPYGYGSAWNDTAAQWLADFPSVPRGRVIVAGTGYDDNVVPVGSDSRFAGCILQLHIYGFWHDTWTTQKQWSDSMTSALGSYSARTLVGEWGAPMTTGTDYGVSTDGDVFRSYVRAVSDIMHDAGMGSCYWPGLRNGDSYSMTTLSTGGSPLSLTVNNTSGLGRLQWAWQL